MNDVVRNALAAYSGVVANADGRNEMQDALSFVKQCPLYFKATVRDGEVIMETKPTANYNKSLYQRHDVEAYLAKKFRTALCDIEALNRTVGYGVQYYVEVRIPIPEAVKNTVVGNADGEKKFVAEDCTPREILCRLKFPTFAYADAWARRKAQEHIAIGLRDKKWRWTTPDKVENDPRRAGQFYLRVYPWSFHSAKTDCYTAVYKSVE